MSLLRLVEALGMHRLEQNITFDNDVGVVPLFTVTGDVLVSVIPVVVTDVTSAAAGLIRLGVVGNTDAMIVDSLSTNLDARGIWVDQTPDFEIEPFERIRRYIITDGNNIILTLSAQIDAGALRFYCFWSPLSTTGKVEVS
ncbi:MAG TPA: hypothetical protein VMV77_06160 [Bacteroidales bacterium]|nr:hypothetical protein [Bacteroidales bacterium]